MPPTPIDSRRGTKSLAASLLCMSVKKKDFGFYMCVCGCLLAAVIEVSAFVSGTFRTRVAQAQITNSVQAY